LQKEEYGQQLADAEIAKVAYLKKMGNAIDESNIKPITDAAQLNDGKEIYTAKCAVCHGVAGEGKVGPNLTDEYWLHGGELADVFKTIKYGVTGKGMIAWEKSLNGLQMAELASYIKSLQGTNPAGALAPQGTKMEVVIADSTQNEPVKDSLTAALK
jgi:cytochrome c oxidase cbb3-type subunit III